MELSTEFDSILGRFDNAKLNTYKVLEIVGNDYTFQNYGADDYNDHYSKLLNCGTMLTFAKEIKGNSTPVYHLTHSNFCRQRICPMCQFRKAEKTFAEMLQVTDLLEQDGYRFLHMVLTIPNCNDGSDLIDGISRLYKGFGKFWANKDIKKAFKGALRCLEVSYNYENDTFHPHLHCLVVVKKSYFNDTKVYLNYDKIREIWTKSINFKTGHLLQVYIRAMKVGDKKGVAEVCKYCMKPLNLDKGEEWQHSRMLLTMWHTLKGTRFVQKYGVIKEYYKKICIDDELTESVDTSNMEKTTVLWDFEKLTYRR